MATLTKKPDSASRANLRTPSGRLVESRSVPKMEGLPPGSARGKRPAEKPIRFAQGAGEGSYREVIHASPEKIASLHTILGDEKLHNLDVNYPVIS